MARADLRRETLVFAIALSVIGPRIAVAGDDDRDLGIAASFAAFSLPEGTRHGAALTVDHRRGISDALALRAALLGAAVLGEGGTRGLTQVIVGVSYALDVLRYVPYVDVGVGATLGFGAGEDVALYPQLELGIGLDVLTGRTRSWGPFARIAYGDDAALVSLGLRVAWRWGYF